MNALDQFDTSLFELLHNRPKTLEEYLEEELERMVVRYCSANATPNTLVCGEGVFQSNLKSLIYALYGRYGVRIDNDNMWEKVVPLAAQCIQRMFPRE